jgi:hypothetical protein
MAAIVPFHPNDEQWEISIMDNTSNNRTQIRPEPGGMATRRSFIAVAGPVSLIWIALAALYAFVPMFAMPGSATVWGSGAAVFVVLAVIIAISERRKPQALKRD